MGDGEAAPYSEAERKRAMVWSALLGWAGVTVIELRGAEFWPTVLFGLPLAAIFGLPIAFCMTWLVGGPILRRLMRQPVRWLQAATWGAVIAVIIAIVSIMIGRFLGWMESIDDSRGSQWGGGDFVRSVDGVLTPNGWLIVGQNTAIFMGIGALIGLAVRALVGPGTAQARDQSHNWADRA